MIKKGILVLSLLAISLNAKAISVDGIFKQGGLIAISYDESKTKKITINNKAIVLDNDGFEYYPIKRSAKNIQLKQTLKNGTVVVKNYKVEKQKYKVQHIKGVKKKHVTPPKAQLARIAKESKEIRSSRVSNDKKYFTTTLPKFELPAVGTETGVFGSSRTYNGIEKNWHKGLDIANTEKTIITSPLKGKVVLAMQDSFYNGNLVIIDHGKKIYSIYAHMYDILSAKGDIVEVGDPIGRIGSTGRSTGPHLHWGLYVGQQAIDPKFLLKN